MFFYSSRWSQEKKEILSVIQGSSLHNGSLHITANIEAMGAWKEEKKWHQNVMCQWKTGRQRTMEEVGQLFLLSTSQHLLSLNSIKC